MQKLIEVVLFAIIAYGPGDPCGLTVWSENQEDALGNKTFSSPVNCSGVVYPASDAKARDKHNRSRSAEEESWSSGKNISNGNVWNRCNVHEPEQFVGLDQSQWKNALEDVHNVQRDNAENLGRNDSNINNRTSAESSAPETPKQRSLHDTLDTLGSHSEHKQQTATDESHLPMSNNSEGAECVLQYHRVIDDVCWKISLMAQITMTFTFEPTSLRKGNFQTEANRHIELLKNTVQSSLSSMTLCFNTSIDSSPIEGARYIYTGRLNIVCWEAVALDNGATTVAGSGQLTDFLTENDELARSVEIVDLGISTLVEGDQAVTLPVTIDYNICVILPTISASRSNSRCTERSNSWQIELRDDPIIGNISLEALISIICCSLSEIGLLVRLLLQKVIPFYSTYAGKIQFCLCLSLLFAYTFFLIGGGMKDGSRPCTVMAVLTHLALLSALCWMNVTAFEIWRTFRHWSTQVISRGITSFLVSVLYSVGVPCLFVTAALIIGEMLPSSELSPSYGKPSCWLNGTVAEVVFFLLPCSIISLTNAIFAGLTLRGLKRHKAGIAQFKILKTASATETTIVAKILVLVGVTWLLGLLSALVNNLVISITFTIVNGSLGLFISMVLVLNRRVFAAVRHKFLRTFTDEGTPISCIEPKH